MTEDHAPPDRRGRAVSRSEALLWRAVVSDVRPLAGREPPDAEAPPPNVAADPPSPPARPAVLPVQPPPPPPPLPALSHGQAPGVDRRTADRMRRGRMAIDGRIDLHGMTRDAAHATLTRFLLRGYDDGRRCLLVITGKGTREGSGILRHAVPRWLNEAPLRGLILGFSHARPQDGGEGALYVLLKRRR